MIINFHKKYVKSYKKLSPLLQKRADEAITLFGEDPFDSRLRNHSLKGSMSGVRSIDAGYDLRIFYETCDDHVVVLMLDVGSHSQLYGK